MKDHYNKTDAEIIADAIEEAGRYIGDAIFDALEHCLGPSRSSDGLVNAVTCVASTIDTLAGTLEESE